jgi:hypothetical protein
MPQFVRRLWRMLRSHRLDADLAEEMEFHRHLKQRDLEEAGLNPADAALESRRTFGSAALAAERSRDVWIPQLLQGLGPDLRLAVRTLVAHRMVSIVAVLSLALGIGANTAIYSVVDSLLLRPLPVTDPGRLVLVTHGTAPGTRGYS